MRANFWPTEHQELLLTVILGADEAAGSAWRKWQAAVPFESIDPASARLLPLLYWTVLRIDPDNAIMGRLKGCLRQTWFANQHLLAALQPVLEQFNQKDVPTLLMKGIPLALQVYPNPGLRPMQDIDIAVPRGFARQAYDILEQQGWSPSRPYFAAVEKFFGAETFKRYGAMEIDLHFSFFPECLDWKPHERQWLAAEELLIGTSRTKSLCPTDMLLHTLAHGARSNPLAPVRWVADAAWIFKTGARIDWVRFLSLAHDLQLEVMAQRTLRYLAARFDVPVPDFVFAGLRRGSGVFQHSEFLLDRRLGIPAMVRVGQYMRQRQQRGWISSLTGVPKYLQELWGTKSFMETISLCAAKTRACYSNWRQFREACAAMEGGSSLQATDQE